LIKRKNNILINLKKMKKLLIMLIIITIGKYSSTGCSSSRGFDMSALRNQLSDEKTTTEEEIRKAYDLKPQLPAPFRLAVFFSYPKSSPWRTMGNWIWSGNDKDVFTKAGDELKQKNIISELLILNDSILEGADRKSIRLAAARAGADAVIIINGISDIDSSNNIFAISYLLLATMFFVPGSVTESVFIANASLWDVRNEYLYLSIESEAAAKETRPAFFTGEKGVIKKAKTAAINILKEDFIKKLINMNNK
jgi:hypothetical protein